VSFLGKLFFLSNIGFDPLDVVLGVNAIVPVVPLYLQAQPLFPSLESIGMAM
jgi:hypothetical protein